MGQGGQFATLALTVLSALLLVAACAGNYWVLRDVSHQGLWKNCFINVDFCFDLKASK